MMNCINILILNWNSSNSIRECLNNINNSNDKDFRVILINNYSTQDDFSAIKNIYDYYKDIVEIHLIENDKNLGYAGGNNYGLKYLEVNGLMGDILILNPDILVSNNTISEMKKALTKNIGIVGVRTLNEKGEIQFDVIKLNGFTQKFIKTTKQSLETDYSQGSCMLINRVVVDEIGLFDERFFLYWEEVDFSLRVKKLGKKLISITSTQITRKNNSISRSPSMFYYSVRNARLLKKKHPLIFSNSSYSLYLLKTFIIVSKFISHPKLYLKVLKNYYFGIKDSILNRYYCNHRNQII